MSDKSKIIKEVKFSNIKGIDKKSFKFKNITNSEINVFVAPNGTGKSTFAFALKSIHANHLDIDPKDRNNKNLDSYVQIIFQDNSETKFTTKDVSNSDIKFDVFESSVKATKKGKYQPGLKTEKITIVKNIPKEITKKEKDKAIDDAKKSVEDIIKVRANKIIDLTKPEIVDFAIENYKTLEKYSLSTVQNFITSSYSKINKSKATNQHKHIEFEKDFVNSDISKVKELVSSYTKFKKDFIATTIVDFLVLCEVLKIKKISFFNDIRKSDNYKKFKEETDNLINLVDTTSKNYSTYVKNNSLMFEIKDATIVSNGERDILNLIANCRRLLYEFDGSSVQYLIIDDIFDYLDYGNLLYGYSILRDTIKSIDNQNFFVIWLTHISDDILKVSARKKDFKFTFYNEDRFLEPNNSDFYTLIKNRNYKDQEDLISEHFLHYSTTNIDVVIKGKTYNNFLMMRKSFELLHQYIDSQKNNLKIDGFALIYAIRLIAEKIAYERLTDKNKFNNCRSTIERIELLVNEKLKEELQLFHSFYNKYFHVDA